MISAPLCMHDFERYHRTANGKSFELPVFVVETRSAKSFARLRHPEEVFEHSTSNSLEMFFYRTPAR